MQNSAPRKFAVIATRNRPEILADAVMSIRPQVDIVYIIDNGDTDRVPDPEEGSGIDVIRIVPGEVNLSRFWNIGLACAEGAVLSAQRNADPWTVEVTDDDMWEVAVINDDPILPEGWFDAIVKAMREAGAAAGCSDPNGSLQRPMLHTTPGPVGLATRMCGWAHIHAGEKGLRYDEDLKWWFGDDDMDWQSREAGGTIMIPGFAVVNRFPDGQFTPELHEQSNRDREYFAQKWNGLVPW